MRMRLVITLAIVVPASTALADRTTGGGGGGRLAAVSSGIAASSQGASTQGGSTTAVYREGYSADCNDYRLQRQADASYRVTWMDRQCGRIAVLGNNRGSHPETTSGDTGATVDGFVAAQKVFESDGSISASLSVVDRWFRLDGALTHYYEREMTGARITMTVPEVSIGARVADLGASRVWVEGGMMIAKTAGDPDGNSSITAPSVGLRVEHQATAQLALAATVEAAFFPNHIHAWAGRIGARYHHLDAGFRVLDFDVGPALFGPEIGVGF